MSFNTPFAPSAVYEATTRYFAMRDLGDWMGNYARRTRKARMNFQAFRQRLNQRNCTCRMAPDRTNIFMLFVLLSAGDTKKPGAPWL